MEARIAPKNAPVQAIEALLDAAVGLIERTTIGQHILALARPAIKDGRIRIVQSQTGCDAAHGPRPAGAYIFDGKTRTIHLPPTEDARLLAPLFFHELVHATDEEYHQSFEEDQKQWLRFRDTVRTVLAQVSARTGRSEAEFRDSDLLPGEIQALYQLREKAQRTSDVRLFKTERTAYRLLSDFAHELVQNEPEYRIFLEKMRDQGYEFLMRPTDEDIVKGYKLQQRFISELKQMEARTRKVFGNA